MTSPAPADLSDAFFARWVDMCGRLGIVPFDLIRVSFSEASCRATAHNPGGHASGIVQMMPATLKLLGFRPDISGPNPAEEGAARAAAFRELAAEDQVPFVERFFRANAKYMTTDALCYVATFVPATLPYAVGADDLDAWVIAAAEPYLLAHYPPLLIPALVAAYKWNPAFDPQKKGFITVGDLGAHLEAVCVGPRYAAIIERLRLAMGLEPRPIPEPAPTVPALPIEEDDGGASRRDATSDAVTDAAEDDVTRRNS